MAKEGEQHKGVVYGHCNYDYTKCSERQFKWHKEDEIEQKVVAVLKGLQIKSKKVASIIEKALQESHKDKIEYYTTARTQLNKRLKEIDEWIERTYDLMIRGAMETERGERKIA